MIRVTLFVLAGIAVGSTVKFPSYIARCARDDPNLSKCALASARAAKDALVRGDRAFRLQPMDPLLISRLRVEQGGSVGLNITMTDISMTGMAGIQFTDNFRLDLKEKMMSYEVFAPRLEQISDYEMKGKILILPITGKGKANFTLVGLSLFTKSPFEFVKRANGKEYVSFGEPQVTMKPTRAYIHFENLFNGDPLLGPQTNLFLNENWKEIVDDVGPSISQGISGAIQQNLLNLIDKIPYDELLPKKLPV